MHRIPKINNDGSPLVLQNELDALLKAVFWLQGFAAANPNNLDIPSESLLHNVYLNISTPKT